MDGTEGNQERLGRGPTLFQATSCRERATLLAAALPIAFAGLNALADLPSIGGVTLGRLSNPNGGAVRVAALISLLSILFWRGGFGLVVRSVVFALAGYVVFDVAVTRRRGLLLALAASTVFACARFAATKISTRMGLILSGGILAVVGLIALGLQERARHAPIRTALPAPSSPVSAPAGARSIVLLSLDTTRADAFDDRIAMPRLNAFAEDALRFENAFASAPHTHPSMASLLTGKPALDHGSLSGSPVLGLDHVTLAEHCRANGYATAGFLDNPWLVPAFGLTRGYEFLSGEPHLDEIAKWLEGRDASRPFLLHVHLFTPHGPYELRESELVAMGGSRFEEARDEVGTRIRAGTIRRGEIPGRHGYGAEEIGWIRDVHLSEVRAMDRWIGYLFELLEMHDLMRDAVVAVVADHGEEFGERGGLHHSHTLFPELVRIPMLVSAPSIEARTEVRATSIADLANLILERAGAPTIDGANKTPSLDDAPNMVLSVRVRQAGRHLLRASDGDWALHVRLTPGTDRRTVALFRIADDRWETHDVAQQHPDVVEGILDHSGVVDALERLRELPLVPQEETNVPVRAWARLESLGY